ncbi:MAG: transcriptional repressor LexA [Alphaproteobacteria bacterium]
MLTRQQQRLLLLIKERLDSDGVPPSFDEMKESLGLASKSGIHRLIMGLEERGFIRRLPHKARALEILKLPEHLAANDMPDIPLTAVMNAVNLPLYGRIAAGTAIEAISDPLRDIAIPPDMIGARARPGDHYALEVDGDSMIEDGILDGDLVIIRRAERAELGDTVVALIDEQEATLKRFNRQNGMIALEPANRHYKTMIYDPNRVRIQGKLVGLMRHY